MPTDIFSKFNDNAVTRSVKYTNNQAGQILIRDEYLSNTKIDTTPS